MIKYVTRHIKGLNVKPTKLLRYIFPNAVMPKLRIIVIIKDIIK